MQTDTLKQPAANAGQQTRAGTLYSPRFDIYETRDELVIVGDMPGVTSENLEIHYEDHELTIHGRVPPRHEGRRALSAEYGVGDYYRVFTVGEAIDAERIAAELSGGVLTLHLPKSEAVKPRRIEVKGS